jgi:hypothetical protein
VDADEKIVLSDCEKGLGERYSDTVISVLEGQEKELGESRLDESRLDTLMSVSNLVGIRSLHQSHAKV